MGFRVSGFRGLGFRGLGLCDLGVSALPFSLFFCVWSWGLGLRVSGLGAFLASFFSRGGSMSRISTLMLTIAVLLAVWGLGSWG